MSELSLGSQNALLARVWALAANPFGSDTLDLNGEASAVFCEACIDPQTGRVNVDVARSLLPSSWQTEFEKYANLIAKEEVESATAEGVAVLEHEPHSVATPCNDELIALNAPPIPQTDVDVEIVDSIDDLRAASGSAWTESPPQQAYVLPPLVPIPRPAGYRSLAELQLNIQSQPIARLLPMCHKALRSEMYEHAINEGRLSVVFGRIEELKRYDKWGLRQRERFVDPPRAASRHGNLLDEMKYIHALKRGDKRAKMAMCHQLSLAVLEFFADRKRTAFNKDTLPRFNRQLLKPVDRFSLTAPDMPLVLPESCLDPLSKQVLHRSIAELPSFSDSQSQPSSPKLIPVSKFIPTCPENWSRVVLAKHSADTSEFEQQHRAEPVAAERQLNFRIRSMDSEIRPPPPPISSLMNARQAHVWQPQDDKMLLKLSRQFPNNWILVAEMLSRSISELNAEEVSVRANSSVNPSLGNGFGAGVGGYQSNLRRRTPWSIFERWVQLTNIEPKEFRGPNAEAAKKWFEGSIKLPQTVKKRQQPLIMAPDAFLRGHPRLRWASMLEGIKKVKRKRETTPKPGNASVINRQSPTTSSNMPQRFARQNTPAALSKLKFDRDRQLAEEKFKERMMHAHPRLPGGMGIPRMPPNGPNRPPMTAPMAASVQSAQANAQIAQMNAVNAQMASNGGAGNANPGSRSVANPPVMTTSNAPTNNAPNAGTNNSTSVSNSGMVNGPMVTASVSNSPNLGNATPNNATNPQSSPMNSMMPSIAGLPIPASMRQQAQQAQLQAKQQQNWHPTNGGNQNIPSPMHMQRLQASLKSAGSVAANSPRMRVANMPPQIAPNSPMRASSPMDSSHFSGQQHASSPVLPQSQPILQSSPMRQMRQTSPMDDMPPAQRARRPGVSKEYIQNLMRQIAHKNPDLTASEVQRKAVQFVQQAMYQRMLKQQQAASRMGGRAPGSMNSMPMPAMPMQQPMPMQNVNQMGQMNAMDPMNQMNAMGQMGSMNAMNPMSTMNPMNPMGQMNNMNAMNNMNNMNAMNAMNNMNSMNSMPPQLNQVNSVNKMGSGMSPQMSPQMSPMANMNSNPNSPRPSVPNSSHPNSPHPSQAEPPLKTRKLSKQSSVEPGSSPAV